MTVRLEDLETMSRSALRKLEPFTGTRIVIEEGIGPDDRMLVREVTYWFDENGVLIRRLDPADRT